MKKLIIKLINKLKKNNKHYSHVNSKGVRYWLFESNVKLRGGKQQKIYYFIKDRNSVKGTPASLNGERYVHENPRNGFLTVHRRREIGE